MVSAPLFDALALDLDGTLLDEHGVLREEMIRGVQALSRVLRVYIASGRMTPSLYPIWSALTLDTPVISYNGAKIVYPGGQVLREHTLSNAVTHDVVAWANARHVHLNIYSDDQVFALNSTYEGAWYSKHFGIPLQHFDPANPWPLQKTTKLLVIVDESALADTFREICLQFGEKASLTTSSDRFAEILPPGVTKGSGLRWLAEREGIPLTRWVAVGDGMNDKEMLEAVGMGFAINSGEKALQKTAHHTIPALPAGGMDTLTSILLGHGTSSPAKP